jgi:hypothetical protein
MRTIRESNTEGKPVRECPVVDVTVHTSDGTSLAGGKRFTFVRGASHTPYDIAQAAIRKWWPTKDHTQVTVVDPMGSILYPSTAKTAQGAKGVHHRFTRAGSLFVYLRPTSV